MHVRTMLAALLVAGLLVVSGSTTGRAQDSVQVAYGDIATIETLMLLVAVEHAAERGVNIEMQYFKSEDVANQAIVNGQSEIGVGAPYSIIQNLDTPIRIFYRLDTVFFFPVVNAERYDTWQDLDGQPMTVHSRTSGTLAMANLMAEREGISYGEISYVPGSEVRALSMLRGNIHATWLDAFNTSHVMREGGDRFKILPMGDVTASNEALFATRDFLSENARQVDVIVEELLKVWRRTNADPTYVVEERERLGLLPDLPEELEPEVLPFHQQAAAANVFPNDGGGARAARQDFELFTVAGQIEGDPDDLNVEDYWDLAPLQRAIKKLGRVEVNYTAPE